MRLELVGEWHWFRDGERWLALDPESMALMIGEGPSGTSEAASILAAQSSLVPPTHPDSEEAEPSVTAVSLCLTHACNLCCSYCFGRTQQHGSKVRMREETALRAIDWLFSQAGESPRVYIDFTGGEPLLAFPVLRTATLHAEARAREAGKQVVLHLTTNGTLGDSEILAFINEHRIAVRLSLDGYQDTHDRQRPYLRGGGSFQEAQATGQRLLAQGTEVEAHAVVMGNRSSGEAVAELQAMGFLNITVRRAAGSLVSLGQNAGPSAPAPQQCSPPGESLHHALVREAQAWREGISLGDGPALRALKARGSLHQAISALMRKEKRYFGCTAGISFVGIGTDGDVYPCHRFVGSKGFKLGSILEGHLERSAYLAPVGALPVCRTCFARHYCGGGCRHEHAASTGSMAVPCENVCRMKRRELELAASVVVHLSAEEREWLVDLGIAPRNPWFLEV